MAFEARSAANVSNILANPLPIAAASISLTARRLPTEAELRSQQVLQLSRVPYFADSTSAFEAFEPVIAPYGKSLTLFATRILPILSPTTGTISLSVNSRTSLSPSLISLVFSMKEKLLQSPSDWMDMPITAVVTSVTPLSTPAGIVIRHRHVDTASPKVIYGVAAPPAHDLRDPRSRILLLLSPPFSGTDRLPTHKLPVAVGATPTPAPRQTRGRSPSKRPATGPLPSPSFTALAPPSLI
ncbi:hypothetical protein V1514DRAFT_318604 [Lipomyces japonicus]|uniref:uncharacterized protein n=1 Tax=Lipomyces japonicus TaxID=56871 RepID=UPI0034CED416